MASRMRELIDYQILSVENGRVSLAGIESANNVLRDWRAPQFQIVASDPFLPVTSEGKIVKRYAAGLHKLGQAPLTDNVIASIGAKLSDHAIAPGTYYVGKADPMDVNSGDWGDSHACFLGYEYGSGPLRTLSDDGYLGFIVFTDSTFSRDSGLARCWAFPVDCGVADNSSLPGSGKGAWALTNGYGMQTSKLATLWSLWLEKQTGKAYVVVSCRMKMSEFNNGNNQLVMPLENIVGYPVEPKDYSRTILDEWDNLNAVHYWTIAAHAPQERCERCGDRFPQHALTEVGDYLICDSCIDYCTCQECGEVSVETQEICLSGYYYRYLCPYCVTRCACCNRLHLTSDCEEITYYVARLGRASTGARTPGTIDKRQAMVCSRCRVDSDYFATCYSCERLYLLQGYNVSTMLLRITVAGRDHDLCLHCAHDTIARAMLRVNPTVKEYNIDEIE